jgi:hypothetical protein
MSFTELTEAFLMKCAGWEEVKIARVPHLAKGAFALRSRRRRIATRSFSSRRASL